MSNGEGGDADPRIKLAYEEAIRGWSLQSKVLDELRSRTGVLLAATSVASAFLGSADLTRHQAFSFWSICALVVFCASVGCCVLVLLPKLGWKFTNEPDSLLKLYVEDGKSIDYMYESLAKDAEEYRVENDEKLNAQFFAFTWASVALGVSVVLWLIDLN